MKMKTNLKIIIRRVGLIVALLILGIDISFAEGIWDWTITSKWQIVIIITACIIIGILSEDYEIAMKNLELERLEQLSKNDYPWEK